MVQRILCPWHEEDTPSCVVYADHVKCFGCGRSGSLSECGIVGPLQSAPRPPQTDLPSELARIEAMPRAVVRGLELPTDGDSYYIVWPCRSFFKRRKFFPGDGPKYIGPRGHKKAPFWARRSEACALAIVEGELNALSVAALSPAFDVMSPGSATDFSEKLLSQVQGYKKFLVLVDKDKAGVEAAKRLAPLLLKLTPYVLVDLMKPDANDLLVAGKLAEKIQGWGKWANQNAVVTKPSG